MTQDKASNYQPLTCILIGAGNVATHIGLRLKAQGATVSQVFSRTEESAKALASRLGCPATNQLDAVKTTADIYILSVKDDALAALVQQLCPKAPQALFVHTAGSMPLSVFEGFARRYGIVYPMQTFSRTKAVDFARVPCFIEGSDAETLEQVRLVASLLSDDVHELTTIQRRYLHLAAVFACNFANHCYAVAEEILRANAIPAHVLQPLIAETAAKVAQLPAREAQTGPAVRHDVKIMEAQAQLLASHPEWQSIYRLMSDDIYNMCKKSEPS